ncbi:VpsF family polysaccharide biosynthesis protein [Bradyrhizobium sp. WSM 1704]|uniref:VpsF family polysaccharide biosynthesis protein n=1 Tax=Bradyrhizobium semiaridum TaxID=2821404 RepID=UPI001CE36AB9|nr:VpsF family polysaccharide biosynthesis protein [Bradyrhizobium semiaridum]MCA6121557.1 VpsF family polysaccharide biosynthesis protein [Bradyrhizobium semiaridum]
MSSRIADNETTLLRAAQPAATIRLRLPFASPGIQKLLAAYILLLFVPSTFLDLVGYDYSSIGGLPLTKIHIATYFVVVVFLAFIASYPQKADLARYYLATKLGTIYFFFAATFAVINIVVGGRSGFGMYFDTDLHLFLCCMLLPFIPPDGMDRLERFLHWFFAINAVLGIFELVTGINVFPLMTYSPDGMTTLEPRATAFLSHPLHAATVTCAYIVSLLIGAGKLLRPNLRAPMIALQTTALLAFGGRTAFLLTLIIVAIALLWQVLRFTAGKPVSRLSVILAIAVVPVGIATISVLAYAGFFDQFLERFTEDGGSARSRVLMLPLLWSFDWTDFLWGANTDYARAQVYSFGLEWGVENPFIQMSVYQGVVVASLVMSGLLLLLYDVYRRLEAAVIFPIVTYLALCNTFGSFAGRFINFSIFIVMVTTLFRRRDVPRNYVT